MRRPVGIFTVKVLKATKLKKKDLLGGADPYVKLKLTEDKLPSKKTTVKHKTLNPEWNEEFHLVVRDPATQALEFMVYDWEKVWLFVSTPQRKGYSFPSPCLCLVQYFFSLLLLDLVRNILGWKAQSFIPLIHVRIPLFAYIYHNEGFIVLRSADTIRWV
jgi:hypothetical protein